MTAGAVGGITRGGGGELNGTFAGSDAGFENPRLVFDRLIVVAGFWTVLGLYTDLGWHIRHHVDTFFTAQHAILYSGLVVLFAAVLLGRRERRDAGVLRGIALFAAGGIADMIKHQTFGIEHDFDALVSPTHLAIGFGVAIAVATPLRSPSLPQARMLREQWPAIVSLAMLVELLHWVTNPLFRLNAAAMYSTPLPHQLTADALTLQTLHQYEQGGAIVAALLQALLVAGPLLWAVRTLRLAPGSCSLLMLLGVLFIAFTNAVSYGETGVVLISALMSGAVADALLMRFGFGHIRQRQSLLALFAGAPVLVFLGVQLLLTALLQRLWWDASFATGILIQSVTIAWFLSAIAFASRDDRASA